MLYMDMQPAQAYPAIREESKLGLEYYWVPDFNVSICVNSSNAIEDLSAALKSLLRKRRAMKHLYPFASSLESVLMAYPDEGHDSVVMVDTTGWEVPNLFEEGE